MGADTVGPHRVKLIQSAGEVGGGGRVLVCYGENQPRFTDMLDLCVSYLSYQHLYNMYHMFQFSVLCCAKAVVKVWLGSGNTKKKQGKVSCFGLTWFP